MRTVLTNANLIDCVDPEPRTRASVVIDHGRISEILTESRRPAAGDACVIDLDGAWLLPGLWDVHVHPDYLSLADMPLPDQVTLFGHRLMAALTESGIVGFRCAGTHHFMDVAWKRAFDSGQYVGPRLFACGHFLTTTGGQYVPSLFTEPEGGFLITWDSIGSAGGDSSGLSIQARSFDAEGVPRGPDFQVNVTTTGNQRIPVAATTPAGDFVVAWQSQSSAGDDDEGYSIQARRYDGLFRDGFESGNTVRWSQISA